MTLLRNRLLALSAALLWAAAAPGARLTILATSDLHGHVEPRDELSAGDLGEGLARVASRVAAIRAEGNPVLLLDSGDTIEGTPLEALHARSGRSGDPTIRAMNAAGYDAMCVGNHEFDFGLDVLERARKDARFPFLSANVVDGKGAPVFRPYVVFERAGARIGVLGLTVSAVPSWEPPSHVGGLRFLDTVETAKKYVPILRGRERCTIVIVVTHQGFERDLGVGRPPDPVWAAENRAWALATEVDGIDLILAGHSHENLPPRRIGKVWVSIPGRFGNFLTRYDVEVERGGIKTIRGENVSLRGTTPDAGILNLVASDTRRAEETLGETVARLEEPVSFQLARTADNAALDWIQRVQREASRADLSFASILAPRLADWKAGPLTVRDLWRLYPYENSLVTVRATGRQVRDALEGAAGCFSGLQAKRGAWAWQRSPAVFFFNCDALAGADYAIDPTRRAGDRVLYLRHAGRDVGDDEVFTVALNSYRAAGGGGYRVWRDAPRIGGEGRSIRDLLIADARRNGRLRLEADFNWLLAPMLPEAP
ncbi:MAG: bifunctional metallophosphatase/5'-nucleotidase [Thermoanaerobaculia bacterium]